MSWNHPEYSGKGGKGKGGGYGGGWSRQQQPWQQNQPWQQQQWQQAQEAPAVDDAAERYNTLSAQLKAKELQLEMLLAKPADAKQEMTEEPEVVRLRQRVQEQEADSRRLKRRLEEQDKIAVEKELEERIQSRVEARLRTEMESRFHASTEPRARPTESPRRAVATAGFAVRSGAGAWAEMEENERRQKAETERKEQENVELRAKEHRQAQEIQQLKANMASMQAMMPKEPGAGATPQKPDEGGGVTDEALRAWRTDELAEWAEQEDSEDKKREWQDLCVLHKVKKVGARWPGTPSGRRKWCEKIAAAEVELTGCGLD